MLSDDVLDGGVCCICYSDFKDTAGVKVAHGEPVVCHECWTRLPAEKKATLKKAWLYTSGYTFNIKVAYQKQMKELTVKPLHDIDQTVYEVFEDRLLCVVGINEKANWEADREINRHLVYEIGKAIDHKERE